GWVAQRAWLGGLGGVGAFAERRARAARAPFPARRGGRGAGHHRSFGFAAGVDVDRHFGEVAGAAGEGGGGVFRRRGRLVDAHRGRGRVDREGGCDALAVAGFVVLVGLGGGGSVGREWGGEAPRSCWPERSPGGGDRAAHRAALEDRPADAGVVHGASSRPAFQRGRAVAGGRAQRGDRHFRRRGDDGEGDRFALADFQRALQCALFGDRRVFIRF